MRGSGSRPERDCKFAAPHVSVRVGAMMTEPHYLEPRWIRFREVAAAGIRRVMPLVAKTVERFVNEIDELLDEAFEK